jgi:hypothetical protein
MSLDDETLLIFALRYALGRRSTAPWLVVKRLTEVWPNLRDWTQRQIRREVVQAIAENSAGDPCDVQTWEELLRLPLKAPEGV